ncbi:hypothetical protein B5807_08267 [Epicoccum nigrum]|uniref:Uncharacterized protein n=1 Tax=Epicoccum nigrum TaxID=105696 RepID=A0A1Y2LPL8_EPING|nr:hypothetical protein B5807_08267 [Epicoccum nigrum]
MLVTVEKEASPEQPHNDDVPDIESVQLVSTPSEAEDATRTSDTSGGRDPEQSSSGLRPIETILTIYRPTWLKETQSHWWTYFDTLWGRNIVDPTLKAIHGTYRLPIGYSFSILPRDAIVRAGTFSMTPEDHECEIAASYSIMKILASIFQLLAATYTLWLHRGDQIARWGFTSFSFVPVPYAIMSLVNGISHLFTPDYPALYMVSSTVMQEATDAGGSFCGVVGHVEAAQFQDSDTGYGSGFDSNWKGLTPGVLRRKVLSLFNSIQKKQKLVKELTVSDKDLSGHAESPNTQMETGEDIAGLLPTPCRAESPVLLVEQSPNFRGKSYMVRAGLRSHNDIENDLVQHQDKGFGKGTTSSKT